MALVNADGQMTSDCLVNHGSERPIVVDHGWLVVSGRCAFEHVLAYLFFHRRVANLWGHNHPQTGGCTAPVLLGDDQLEIQFG